MEARWRIDLEVRHQGRRLSRQLLDPGWYWIGSDPNCGICLDLPGLEPSHLKVDLKLDEIEILGVGEDAESLIQELTIRQGLRVPYPVAIRVGQVEIRLDFALTPEARETEPSRQRTGYVKFRRIAQGSMGGIDAVEDLSLGRRVAMKSMLPDKQALRQANLRFIREARVLGQLDHPNIVPVYDLGIGENGEPYYTMKYVQGRTLKQILHDIRHGQPETTELYPLDLLIVIFQKVCDAVAFAHSKGVVHRDLKPENIMVAGYGQVLVMDWGLAKVIHETEVTWTGASQAQSDNPLATLDGDIMGTPQFMSPEQAEGRIHDIDERSDVFALGGILYNILTLRPPFKGSSLTVILNLISKGEIIPPTTYNDYEADTVNDPDAPPEGAFDGALTLPHCPGGRIPEMLSDICMQAMSLDPDHRYPNVKSLQKDVAAYQRSIAVMFRRNKRPAVIALCLGLTLVASMTTFIFSSMKARAEYRRLQGGTLALVSHAKSSWEEGQRKEAEATLEAVMKLRPTTGEAAHLKSRILLEQNEPRAAKKWIRRALKLSPDDPAIRKTADRIEAQLKK